MKKTILTLLYLFPVLVCAQSAELRGTWVAWAGANYPTKTEIAHIIQLTKTKRVNQRPLSMRFRSMFYTFNKTREA